MKTLRILHTEASQGWGGQEIRILNEAAGMTARGHYLAVASTPEANITREAHTRGIACYPLPIGKKRLRGLLALRLFLKKNPFDIINTHSSTDSWLASVACIGLKNAPKIIRTRHVSVPVANSWTNRWLYGKAAAHVATTGEMLRELLINSLKLTPTQVSSIPTGMDSHQFYPTDDKQALRQRLGLKAQGCYIGIVATLRSWKGHRFLVDALKQLPEEVELLIVGDGPGKIHLIEQIAKLQLQSRVHMVGNQRDVLPWLQSMDIFVLPSYANEGVPQAILQAMLCALPIVSTPVGSIAEAVQHDYSALLVEPQNSEALAQAIQQLLAAPEQAKTFANHARNYALEYYSFESMLDKMEAVFQAALEK